MMGDDSLFSLEKRIKGYNIDDKKTIIIRIIKIIKIGGKLEKK